MTRLKRGHLVIGQPTPPRKRKRPTALPGRPTSPELNGTGWRYALCRYVLGHRVSDEPAVQISPSVWRERCARCGKNLWRFG